jgi:putative hydrolase
MVAMSDPFSGGFDPNMFQNVPLFRELAKVMSWSGGPVNWDLAGQTALAIAAPDTDDAASAADSAAFADAVAVAELWLDEVTVLARVDGPARALGRAEWARLATSSSGLGVFVEPVAQGMGAALQRGLGGELEGLGAAGLGGQVGQALKSMGAMLYGVQIGTVAGHLAGQLLGTYDLGLPTVDAQTIGPVGDAARRFAADYEFDATEFRHWLALREAAHRRQFVGVAWLRAHVAELVRRFAAGAEFDPQGLLEQLGGMGFDPGAGMGDPDAMRRALERPDAFRVEATPAQRQTLGELQALVAFTASWVDTVVGAAAGDKLPSLARIAEAIRRRRAEKGPGERFLEQLIGLDLKLADLRQGQAFCDAVLAARGQEGLDRAWQAPETLPSPAELADPSRWLVRMAARELEAGEA